jgi:tripartite-type tricarboxylate transporter receptor subunit TctC
MALTRRQVIKAALSAPFLLGLSHEVGAQSYPTRSIKVIIPRAPGGGSDVIARLLSPGMQQKGGNRL